MAKRILYLVRHGQEDRAASEGEFGGPLTALGRRQARRAARRLAAFPIHAIIHSDYHRAAETARLIADRLPAARLRAEPLIRESVPGLPTRPHPYFDQFTPEQLRGWRSAADAAFAKLFVPTRGRVERHEAVVCHGNIIRYLMCRATDNDPGHWRHWDIQNCGICIVEIDERGACKVLAHNDTGHMPEAMKTYI